MRPTVILPYSPVRTTQRDVAELTRRLADRDPEVRLLAYDDKTTPIALAETAPGRTITVTLNDNKPTPIFEHLPGPKFFANRKSKTELMADLLSAGIAVPYTEPFSPDMTLDEAIFGPYTAIKTTVPGTTQAKGIHVFKTAHFGALRDRLAGMYRSEITAGHVPQLQQYIRTGSKPTHTRVATFLGAPILCFSTTAPDTFSPETLEGIAGGAATSNFHRNRTCRLSQDEGMVDLARAVCRVFPETSVLNIDMVRCQDTGKLYCIEANLEDLCVLSAPICSGLREELGDTDLHRQFGSYDTIARRMIETLRQIPSD